MKLGIVFAKGRRILYFVTYAMISNVVVEPIWVKLSVFVEDRVENNLAKEFLGKSQKKNS